jgi:hypothetical protein
MNRHRFRTEVAVNPLPHPPEPEFSPAGFAWCPVLLLQGVTAQQWLYQQWVYRRAFEEAQAVVRPSLPERDLLGVWN